MDSEEKVLGSGRSLSLSPAMIASESFTVYDSYSFMHHPAAFKVLCLKELQGFLFNQDLFASPYQQSRSAAQEKSRVSSMRKKRSKSQGQVSFSRGTRPKQRSRSSVHASRADLSGSQMSADSSITEDEPMQDAHEAAAQPGQSRRSGRSSISEQFNTTFQRGLFDPASVAFSSSDDDMDSGLEPVDYSPIGSNHIPVVEICVGENEPLIPEYFWEAYLPEESASSSEEAIVTTSSH